MAIPPRVVPRRAEPTDLMKVTPSGRVDFQGQSVGTPPQVRASSAVQQPTPYVGKTAPDKGLFMLAEGLQYFNAEIGKLAYTQRQQWEEGQVEKATAEAITNPDKVAEVFRVGLDKATEQGLFPRNAHPKYRIAYLEQGAKNMALMGLPAVLEEKARSLTTADSTEPIESTLNAFIDEYANDSGLTSSPIAYAAFREAAFPATLRVAADTRQKREENFNNARLEGLEQNINGQATALLSAMSIEKETDRDIATSQSLRGLQTTYNNIRRDFPQVDATKEFTSSFLSSLNASVYNGQITPRDAMQVGETAASSLKSGTGAWADISDVQTAISGVMATWEGRAASQGNTAQQIKNQKEAALNEKISDAFEQTITDGTFTQLNNNTDLEVIGVEAALEVYPEMAGNTDFLRRKVRELKIETQERLENSEKFFTENPTLEKLLDEDPQMARVYLNANKSSINRETFEKYSKKIDEVDDIKKFLDEGGYTKKLSEIEPMVRDTIAPKNSWENMIGGTSDPLTSSEQEEIVELQSFGEQTFRTLSTEFLRTELMENPELRQDQVSRETASMKAVNAAWTETQKRMTDYRVKSKGNPTDLNADPVNQKQQKIATYGTFYRTVSLLEDARDNMTISENASTKQEIFETLTTAQNVDFKIRFAEAPKELNSIASKMGMASPSDPEYNQLKAAYNKILGIAGYGAQSVIRGKTEHGMPVDVNNIKQNWRNVPIFRNNEEYQAVWKEAKEAVAPVSDTKNLLDFVKQAEGFASTAVWDNKQWSVGYGTKGSQGETLSEAEALARLEQELQGHAAAVDTAAEAANVSFTEGQRNALISFGFNNGDSVVESVIKRFGGNPTALKKKMMEYTKETKNGQLVFSQGLQNRRLKEIAMFDSAALAPSTLPTEPSTLEQLFSILEIDTPEEEREFTRRQSMFSRQRTP